MIRVAVEACAALSAFGAGTRGIARALERGDAMPGLPPEEPLGNPRARKMMSRGAYLAARCLAQLRGPNGHDASTGYYLGVGASAGALSDVIPLLEASIVDGAFSLPRFGDRGLAACNPLLAFQLMNNFTMCHGAILEGIGGPNGAIFSRGAGTIAAIGEAVYAVRSGECARAIGGGADVATHPVAIDELRRDGFIDRGLEPADGAGVIAFRAAPDGADVIVVEEIGYGQGQGRGHDGDAGVVVIAPWGPPAADALRSYVAAHCGSARVIDTSALGESLAATAALAMIVAIDALLDAPGRAIVLTLGVDGERGVIALSRGAV